VCCAAMQYYNSSRSGESKHVRLILQYEHKTKDFKHAKHINNCSKLVNKTLNPQTNHTKPPALHLHPKIGGELFALFDTKLPETSVFIRKPDLFLVSN